MKIGSRGKNLPVGSYYGWGSGIVGLRLFPNPDFDEAAAKRWDPKRYYNDPSYYNDKNLVRPYRVAMTCGFCHVGPNPVKPPADPENPKWENLSSNVGAQYFWIDRIFAWESESSSFPVQLFHTSRPGTLDTSLISSDNINNPRTMNAVYNLLPRLEQGKRWGKETLAGGELNNKQFNDYVSSGPLTQFFQPPNTALTARILKDGSDSVGALGALNRVYLNIGLFSEEWLLHFRALVGGAAHHSYRDRRRQQEFRLLGGDRGDNARHGALLSEEHRSAPAEGCTRRRCLYLTKTRRSYRARQDRFCRALCAMPLQQGPDGAREWMPA